MVQFANPTYLYLLLLIPLLGLLMIFSARLRRRQLEAIGDPRLVRRLTDSLIPGRRRWKNVLLLLAIAFLVVGLADPQMGTKLEEVKRQGVDIFVALDVSNSMLAEDVAPNRLERAKHEVMQFINQLQGDRIGLIPFAGIAFVHCPLTLDYEAAKIFLNEITPDLLPLPGTAIAEAIETARRSFVAKEKKHKVLIIITDGEDHEADPVAAAKKAAEDGVIIYTIGIGSTKGAPIPVYDKVGNRIGYKRDRQGQIVTTRLNPVILQQIAGAGHGKFYLATGRENELQKIYSEIARMEKKELGMREYTQFEDHFQPFLLIALVLLILEFIISERKTQTISQTVKTEAQTH